MKKIHVLIIVSILIQFTSISEAQYLRINDQFRKHITGKFGLMQHDFTQNVDENVSKQSGFVPVYELYYQEPFGGIFSNAAFFYDMRIRVGNSNSNVNTTTKAGDFVSKVKSEDRHINAQFNITYLSHKIHLLQMNFFGYIGLGYTQWTRRVNSSIPYKEIYTYYYLPIGFKFSYNLLPGWTGNLDLLVNAHITGDLNILDPTFSKITFSLSDQYSLSASMPFNFHINTKTYFSITPWFNRINIGDTQSKVVKDINNNNKTVSREASVTEQFGVNLGLNFIF